jgi:HAE1 family hydrophobic/amphiphilic exporter-1
MVALATAAAHATEPAPAPAEPPWRGAVWLDQWRSIPPSPALDVPMPVTRDDAVQRVTLKETIAIALENNPGIAARRLEPARFGTNVLQAQSVFDPAFLTELDSSKSITPSASGLTGVTTSAVDQRSVNAHLSKLFRSSTRLSIDSLNERLDNNAQFFNLRPQYTPQLGFSLVQPLLRDFGWDFSYLVVRVAEQEADASVYLYEADLADFVTRVIVAYWRVVAAREAVAVREEAKGLADRTVQENEARVRVGLLPPVAVLEAQADAALREEQLIAARNELAVARQELAQLAFFRPSGTFVPRTLEPVEDIAPEDIEANIDRALETALADRPEIIASAHGVEARQIQQRIASNSLLPRLDMVGGYSVNGLSGTAQPSGLTFISSVDLSLGSPTAKCRLISVGIYSCTLPLEPSQLDGGPGAAYGTQGTPRGGMLSGDFHTYSFGLRLTVPLDNALARSQHTRSQIELDQAQFNHRDLLSRVTLEVRRTGADLASARQRIDTSRIARELAEENLRNQEKRHEVGMATTKDLLDFQTRLTEARFAEVQSKLDYNVAVARWRRAQGQLLDHYQIVLEHPGKPSTPWFARF